MPTPVADPTSPVNPQREVVTAGNTRYGGAVGPGLVLVLLPSAALFFGVRWLDERPGTGLAVVVVFGIMVLVGVLALTSTLFSRLGLARRSQPLGLPPGSVRATIALALILLFAIIAISMQHLPLAVQDLTGLDAAARDTLLKDTTRQVLSQLTEPCTGPPNPLATKDWTPPPLPCAASDLRYTLHVQMAPSAATLDLSKQLLVLIGNLMTMAVSFYFAGRTADKAAAPVTTGTGTGTGAGTPASGGGGGGTDPTQKTTPNPDAAAATLDDTHDSHVDGCNVPITNPTPDQALPAAQGGTVSK